jgi:hypothetical protein
MVKVSLRGDVHEFENGVTPYQIAQSISAGLARVACAAKINGEGCDLRTPIEEDCEVEILTFDDPFGKKAFWHTTSHVMAQAVLHLFPNAKFSIGPAIDNGFYYDFDVEKPFTVDDLKKIEDEMAKIIKTGLELNKFTMSVEEAKEVMKDQPYKLELIDEHAGKGEALSFYKQGDFTELCGFKVVGETSRKYWATGPSTEKNCLGFVARRRFGYMCLPLGKLEFSAPKENFEELAVDDEDAEPFILRCKNGKGEVLFMNWWAYPAAANMDVGCGSEIEDVGMVGYLYRYAAKLARGNVYITGRDFENPDEDCGWILYSYFPDEGKVYLLNLDYERERKFVLQQFGDKDFITLKPGEFAVFYPKTCAHAPACSLSGPRKIRKIIVKVKA